MDAVEPVGLEDARIDALAFEVAALPELVDQPRKDGQRDRMLVLIAVVQDDLPAVLG